MKRFGGIALVILGLIVVIIIARPPPDQPLTVTHPNAVPSPGPGMPRSQGDAPLVHLTAAEHIAEAKKSLDEARLDIVKRAEYLDLAEKHMGYIGVDAPEDAETRAIRLDIAARKRLLALKAGKAYRAAWADTYEKKLLLAGMDAHVTVNGSWNTVLHIEWILMSRPLAYKLAHEGDFLADLGKAGFVKVVLTDGRSYGSFTERLETGAPGTEPERTDDFNVPPVYHNSADEKAMAPKPEAGKPKPRTKKP